ncbi:MAG: UDP-glucose 4-epimerase GalE [Clostridia bacterium]|nr:UDP-glucose 4-epimerase GalE [Clostridia bacterium]
MKILLTGGAGYIGTHTAIELLNAGYDIVVADNYSNSQPESMKRAKQITGRDFNVYEMDIRDKAKLEVLFEQEKPEAVIHFAGLKAVGESVEKPLDYYENNLDATFVLLRVMEKYGCKKIVFSSSATVYGEQDTMPLVETMKCSACSNPYGWTKYMIEQILRDYAKVHEDWSVVLLRYFNPVGAHESGMVGENPNGIPNNLMPRVTQAALGKIKMLGVMGNDYPTPDGTCLRDYIHVVDLAKGHVCAIRYAEENNGCDVFNLGTGVGYSVLDIINTFEEVNHIKVPHEIVARRPGDLPMAYSNPSKAEKILHWKAEKTLADMCRDSWNWQQKNPNGY